MTPPIDPDEPRFMSLFLQVMGVVFLVILGLVAFLVVPLIVKIGLFVRTANKLVSGLVAGHPPEIKLVEVVDGRWDDDAATNLARPLPGLGFTEVGFFEVAEVLGGIRLQAWVHAGQGLYAAIYQSPQAGVWMDFVTKYADGTSLTLSNSPYGGVLKQRPGQENVYDRDLDAEGLYRKAMTDRPDKPVRALTPADFPGDFERAYAEEMAWRARPEGFTPEATGMAEALAGAVSGKFDPGQMAQIRGMMSVQMYNFVANEFRTAYRESSGMSDEEWSRDGDSLLFIWDHMDIDALPLLVPRWAEWPEMADANDPETGEGRLRPAFAGVNDACPEWLRYRKVGEVTAWVDEDEGEGEGEGEPLEADVYQPPAPASRRDGGP